MLTEIKLYLLTRHLMHMYDENDEKVIKELEYLVGSEKLHPDYFQYWMRRFQELDLSKEVQVTLLREAGYSYRKIQNVLGIAPNTIQRILNSYELADYGELEETVKLSKNINALGERIGKGGVQLW